MVARGREELFTSRCCLGISLYLIVGRWVTSCIHAALQVCSSHWTGLE